MQEMRKEIGHCLPEEGPPEEVQALSSNHSANQGHRPEPKPARAHEMLQNQIHDRQPRG